MFHHVSLVCVSPRNTQDFLCVVFCEDSWKPRKKKPTPRKLRKRNGERQKQIEQKSSGFWQRLKWILGAKYCATWTVRAPKSCNYHGKWEVRTAKYCKMLLKWQFLVPKCPEYCSKGNGQDRRSKKNTKRKKKQTNQFRSLFQWIQWVVEWMLQLELDAEQIWGAYLRWGDYDAWIWSSWKQLLVDLGSWLWVKMFGHWCLTMLSL